MTFKYIKIAVSAIGQAGSRFTFLRYVQTYNIRLRSLTPTLTAIMISLLNMAMLQIYLYGINVRCYYTCIRRPPNPYYSAAQL
ncbi:hypothetical protein LIPSTDRAFT_206341 [Lipomyces starkeyi NRRL Y-11557]|uniref:Uncharacterized protein n=1 Tax=Lipomyces starkeyi NRRL Y-11557 TaxID=675824 RepID=A0A1E3QCK8_LIPST|nr:hypothetical protein LIPSTDRAFT_206341 [Lipomyces starkeyi NRRL Y-11557]